ncbi:fatty acid synthase [Trichonephila clavipes]|nr:fatty acid synthase [Trichonephila clavipes]
MASKRKHSTLTLKDKLEVLKRLDKGEGVTKLATEFNVGKASVGDINEWMEEDGETAEFLTDDDIAAAVTQEPMEEEGSDDETQCDKKDVVPHADGAAALALRYLEQQPDTTPADVLFMRRWRNYASSKRLSSLYNEGVDPKIERLYPPVKFPVPRGIPSISDLIKWNHSQSYIVPKYTAETSEFSMEFKFDKEDAYILDHKIDGRSLFPATALTKFYVNVQDSSGRFEIKEDRSIVASGNVYEGKKLTFQQSPPSYNSSNLSVSASDIHDELKRSGYEYGPCFQGLVESNMDGAAGLVQWKGQWIPFLDALLLFFGIIANEEGFYLPTGALSFKIDPNVLINAVQSRDPSEIEEGNNCSRNLPVKFNQNTKTCRTVGVEITKMIVEPAPNRRKDENPTFEKYAFVPYESIYTPTSEASLQLSKYFNACNIFMDKIGKTLRKDTKQYQFLYVIDDMFCLEEYVEKITENQHLLKVLKQSIDNENILKEKRKDWFLSYSRFAGRDMLNNSLLNEYSLRIMLEIISENTFRKLNVLEINRNFPVSLIPATEIMQKYSHLRFKKSTLVASNMDSFNQEALDEHGIQVKTEEGLTDIASEKAQDVAISSFACGPISELENLLQTLISVIKSDGFILLFYKEKANSAELFLSSLCGEKLQVQSQGVLEEILKAKNLVILSKISDSFGSSLYLLRSPSPIAPSKVVFITEDSYSWVDKVKDELFEKKSGIVWLVSKDSPTSGIVGMVNCLKQEPGGERIRSIFMSQKKQENNIPTFSFENPFYRHLVTKNLIMNVWRNGSWGSFRHILIRENISGDSCDEDNNVKVVLCIMGTFMLKKVPTATGFSAWNVTNGCKKIAIIIICTEGYIV